MYDPTLLALRSLDPRTQERAVVLITLLREAGVPAIIQASGARRTWFQQLEYVFGRKSRRALSAHLAGKAFDLDVAGVDRGDIPQAFWRIVGPLAEMNLGLLWGGRWSVPYDPGHFELPDFALFR